jgi:hypothetical protein
MRAIIFILLFTLPVMASQADHAKYEHDIFYFDWLDDWSESAADGMGCKEIRKLIIQLSDHMAVGPLDCKWDCDAIVLIDYTIDTSINGQSCDDARYGLPCVDRCHRMGLIIDLQQIKRIYCNWIQTGKNSGVCLDDCKPCD